MRIVISGATGLLGSVLCQRLKGLGYHVIGLARNTISDASCYPCDLVNEKPSQKYSDIIKEVDVVIHLAAIAHVGIGGYDKDCGSKNLAMLNNMLSGTEGAHWIFPSSVRVYDMFHQNEPINLNNDIGALDGYGQSKIECEKILLSRAKNVDILRLAPVFDERNLKDFKKRVFLPGGLLKAAVHPPPSHSFCHTKTFCDYVLRIAKNTGRGQYIHNCCDDRVYSQNDMVKMFAGPKVKLSRDLVKKCLDIFFKLNGSKKLNIQNKYDRFFMNNIYVNEEKMIVGSSRLPIDSGEA